MSRYLSLISALLLCLALPAAAETPSPEAMTTARNLVTTMGLADQYRALLPVILLSLKPVVTQDRPEIEQDYDSMAAMIANAYTPFYNQMIEQAATLYATNFTLDELRQLDNFYHQPVGQKLLRISQGLRQQTTQIGQDISRKATDELRARLTDALRQKGHKL
ncbi:DUF2059 domain-containing protein [Bradyrhizobium sp. Tv2a-2]|uniref:DUF2059 domain-containing protein n=1 Tax=Bradyrhizobium sp. Tv2a-2 TaxID=113395 RepID=UPI0003F823D0|nr:DUF2059 domain-containing protein [Bradyrhizobium sp. Tv2a-2]